MTESAPHLVKDSRLAHEAALEELPYRELELTAKRIGHNALAEEMNQRADSASEGFLKDREDRELPSATEEMPEPVESKESTEYTDEKILELLKDKLIAGATWFTGKGMSAANVDSPGAGMFKTFFGGKVNRQIAEELRSGSSENDQLKTHASLLKAYAEKHIPELITFSPRTDGRGVVLTYETVSRALDYKDDMVRQYAAHHRDGANRPGNLLNYVILLPETEAEDLSNAIQADPSLVHKLTDTMMTKHFGMSEEEWSKIGPDYDAWRDIDGGTSKIALRTSLTDTHPTVLSF